MEKTAATLAVNLYGWGQNDVKNIRFYEVNKKWQNQQTLILPNVVRVKGLEPLRRKTPDPKSRTIVLKNGLVQPFFVVTMQMKNSLKRIKTDIKMSNCE